MQLSIAKKLYCIIMLLIVVAAAILALGVYSLSNLGYSIGSVGRQSDRAIAILYLDRNADEMARVVDNIINSRDTDQKTALAGERVQAIVDSSAGYIQIFDDNLGPTAPKRDRDVVSNFRAAWGSYMDSARQAIDLGLEATNFQAMALSDSLTPFWLKIDGELDALANSMIGTTDPQANKYRPIIRGLRATVAFIRLDLTDYFAAPDEEAVAKSEAALRAHLKEIDDTLRAAEKDVPPAMGGTRSAEIRGELRNTAVPVMEKIVGLVTANSIGRARHIMAEQGASAFEAVKAVTVPTLQNALTRQASSVAAAQAMAIRVRYTIIIVGLAGIIVSLALAVFILRRMTRQLMEIISHLGENSRFVHNAADSISETAQTLAGGSAKQAATLGDESSAIGEMSATTRQNAENTDRASNATRQNEAMIRELSHALTDMSGAMEAINESAEQIGRIIKSIDDIAFQTNLLALNAAVEAARAGETGKGFAVVADEVRNLAGRSAQAARDTTQLIETTIERVRNGTGIASKLDASFKDIESGSQQVAKLIAEIAAATSEQARGVEQVSHSVSDLEQLTQQNASHAEESAAAAEELAGQAEQLRATVEELSILAEGAKGRPESADGKVKLLAV